jgi:hypothetical protein
LVSNIKVNFPRHSNLKFIPRIIIGGNSNFFHAIAIKDVVLGWI